MKAAIQQFPNLVVVGRWPAELFEALDGRGLFGVDIENGEEFGDLQEIFDLFGQIQELKFALPAAHGGKAADQLSDAGAVNVINVAKIQKDPGLSALEQIADQLAQQRAALSEGNPPAEIDNRNFAGFSCSRKKGCHFFT
jgi:hypothetical protein